MHGFLGSPGVGSPVAGVVRTVVLRKAELAARLGVPPERLHFEVVQDGRLVMFEMLVDGRDLTAEEQKIAMDWVNEHEKVTLVHSSPGRRQRP